MRAWVTCGPACEAVDAVRRITNFSTGDLGARLAEKFAARGHEVVCFRGAGSTAPSPALPVECVPFFGNRDLLEKMTARSPGPDWIFHAAALSDFETAAVFADGREVVPGAGKISSGTKRLVVELRPAPKVLGELSVLFPTAKILGWKYEVEGDAAEAIRRGERQLVTHHAAGCVVNGPALGSELILLRPEIPPLSFPGRTAFLEGILEALNL